MQFMKIDCGCGCGRCSFENGVAVAVDAVLKIELRLRSTFENYHCSPSCGCGRDLENLTAGRVAVAVDAVSKIELRLRLRSMQF